MQIQLPQFFEDSDQGFVTFDLSFLQRGGRAQLVAGAPATVEFEIEAGKAGYIVESGNNLSFQWGPGRSGLKLARQRQMMVELAAKVLRGNPSLKLYIIQYDSDGRRLRESSLKYVRDRFQGSLTLARDVASYMLALRLTGRGIVGFGEFHTFLDSSRGVSGSSGSLAIAASIPAVRAQRKSLVSRVANAITRLDRRHVAKGLDLARFGARRLRSKMSALAETARRGVGLPEPVERASLAFATAASRPQLKLRKLNEDIALLGKSDTAAWLTDALKFALGAECLETAERLARYGLAIWPQVDVQRRKALLLPLVEALTLAGDDETARAMLDANAGAVRLDDRLTTYARLLDAASVRDRVDFLLPSGKLDAYSLSRGKIRNDGAIASLYKLKKRLFTLDPQNHLLLCNAEVGKSEALYCSFLNKSLAQFDVGRATAVTFGESILDTIRFRSGSPVHGGPLVSIIMTSFNAAGTVGYAIRSLLQQEYRNVEILICDDASDDGTPAAIAREARDDERVRVFRSGGRQGIQQYPQCAADHDTGRYVTFQDADGYALPSRIRLQLGTLIAQKSRAVVAREIFVRRSGTFVFFERPVGLEKCD